MKVCWLSNYFSPYTISQFNEIGKEIELTALMLGGKDENRNNEWTINKDINFKVVLIDNNFNKTIKKLAEENDVLIDSMYSTKYGIIAVSAFKRRNKKVIMQADGGIAYDRGIIVNRLISLLMNRHDYFISSSKYTNNYFKYYGVDEKKIFICKFTSLSENDISFNSNLSKQKKELRKELNIGDNFTLISVGQPIKRKGFDILLNSYIKTNNVDNINLYIIGGKPQEEIIKIVKENDLKNVHFIDLITSSELKKYYAASDCFILCTREDIWGLVVQEAMSFGLSIITSDNCVAGLHFNDLTDSVIINSVNDICGYAKDINLLYKDKKHLNELSKEALKVIKDYTIENSSNDILNVLNNI